VRYACTGLAPIRVPWKRMVSFFLSSSTGHLSPAHACAKCILGEILCQLQRLSASRDEMIEIDERVRGSKLCSAFLTLISCSHRELCKRAITTYSIG
jgi:hypothetical protein